ncbi:MAG: hypothetical protein JNN24_03375 [Hyphomicrobium zavarzinii]|uniref:hypothetical protein n=1 Tax=Hyphomicrobium zavarzinii TaxID=48292 RepID=UPI001A500AB7|nr:hypothetical protein [Hyphomicrobium zavarzinii]MBL8844791.1 hypothetical protein [Hyphomicrobium zavarzinii]
MTSPTEEIWEERRGPRSGFGKLLKWGFILFNLWMLVEIAVLFSRVDQVRGQYRDNGFAQLGINAVANTRLNEIFVIWAIGAVILGAGVLATRGKKQMVRLAGAGDAAPAADDHWRPSAEAQALIERGRK